MGRPANRKGESKFLSRVLMLYYIKECTIDVDVLPPDFAVLDESFLNVSAPQMAGATPTLTFDFHLSRGPAAIDNNMQVFRSVYALGAPIEYLQFSFIPARPAWTHPGDVYVEGNGANGNQAPYLNCTTAGLIRDGKGCSSNAPPGATHADYDQTLSIRLPVACGGTQVFPLGPTFRFQVIIDPGNKFHVERVN